MTAHKKIKPGNCVFVVSYGENNLFSVRGVACGMALLDNNRWYLFSELGHASPEQIQKLRPEPTAAALSVEIEKHFSRAIESQREVS